MHFLKFLHVPWGWVNKNKSAGFSLPNEVNTFNKTRTCEAEKVGVVICLFEDQQLMGTQRMKLQTQYWERTDLCHFIKRKSEISLIHDTQVKSLFYLSYKLFLGFKKTILMIFWVSNVLELPRSKLKSHLNLNMVFWSSADSEF